MQKHLHGQLHQFMEEQIGDIVLKSRFKLLVATAVLSVTAVTATAQVPADIAAKLRKIGPVVDPQGVMALYAPLLAKQPKDGVKVTKDVKYGDDTAHVLDVYQPKKAGNGKAPMALFFHGGAYMFGDKSDGTNYGYYFARHGVVLASASYRLAPAHQWPAGPQDVAKAVAWAKAHAADYGADPDRIFAIGASAGASHVAAYALSKAQQPPDGSGLAGIILGSGSFDPALELLAAKGAFAATDPTKIDAAYYGNDVSTYKQKSVVLNLDAAKLPTLIVYAQLDPVQMQVQSAELFAALCHKFQECPELKVLKDHDHISEFASINTRDETASKPLLDFIKAD